MEMVKQFGPLGEDRTEKVRYCKFKAADILKAIKEGKTPKVGGPGEQEEEKV